eukprot:4226202-Alexandrium_andersonii.AAC.1
MPSAVDSQELLRAISLTRPREVPPDQRKADNHAHLSRWLLMDDSKVWAQPPQIIMLVPWKHRHQLD